MAIYHLEAKVIGRSSGRSAVAASAYMSCSKILNDYDGVLHDFTRKRGLVWEHIFLPENAQQEWQERSELWNAVERTEKTKDSRLARELVVALPVELGKDQWVALLTDYIQSNFVADGMCADVAIHDTDGHNPHAHHDLAVVAVNPCTNEFKAGAVVDGEQIHITLCGAVKAVMLSGAHVDVYDSACGNLKAALVVQAFVVIKV